MTRDEFLNDLIEQAKKSWSQFFAALPDEQRLRLAGMETELGEISRQLSSELWKQLGESMDTLATTIAGQCEAGCRRERRREVVSVDVLAQHVKFPATYFYCRRCRQGACPVRQWLGLESGGVSLGFERALTDLTTRMTFGDATESMREHHSQDVDRTKAERITYSVAHDAQKYWVERRRQAQGNLDSGEHPGVPQLVFTADGGAVPVGTFSRPKAQAGGAQTEVRKLAKGTRVIAGREARFIAVHKAGSTKGRVVECHIAPYEKPQYTGERMFAAAVLAGLGDTSRIHGVFDMGKWIHTQFAEQFFAYDHSACADIMHVAQYLIDAGRVLVGEEKALAFGMEHKRRMLAGEIDAVLATLKQHTCQATCKKDDGGKCLVRTAERYITNNRLYMENYEDFMVRNLPVGSGEAESGIRHVIKRRMAVAGAWTEPHAELMLSLLAIRASGFWDDFWMWRSTHDKLAWNERKAGTHKVVCRNKRLKTTAPKKAA